MSEQRSMWLLLLRLGFYTVAIFLLTGALPWLLQSADVSIFKENGVVECTQLILLVVVVFFFVLLRYGNHYKDLSVLFGSIAAIAAVRELDALLDDLIPYAGWQLPAGLLLLFVTSIGWRERAQLIEQMTVFVHSKAFGLLWAGFIIAIPLGQLIGHGEFLETLMGNAYERDYKRVVEESAEIVGYMVLVFGAAETYLETRGST